MSDPETYGDYSVDDEDQLPSEDTLVDEETADPLDRGYSPPDHYSPAQSFGNTPEEEATGETLEQRIAQEVPEPDPYSQAEEPATAETDADADPGTSAEEAAVHVIPDNPDEPR